MSESDTFRTLWTFQYISCYSLSNGKKNSRNGQQVSIHLMLLFISFAGIIDGKRNRFNTSHVTLYRIQKRNTGNLYHCFNTSHVTLYLVLCAVASLVCLFQYISCYSLSTTTVKIIQKKTTVSIHLMLLFIGYDLFSLSLYGMFQYISCYSLSAALDISTCTALCFNTSHVTLYPVVGIRSKKAKGFQYISCYSLSVPNSFPC